VSNQSRKPGTACQLDDRKVLDEHLRGVLSLAVIRTADPTAERAVRLENYYYYRLAIWAIPRLPRWFLNALAMWIADLTFLFSRSARRGVMANQAHVLPADTPRRQRLQTTRATFRYGAFAIIDFFRMPRMNRSNLDQFVAEVIGWEHVESAMKAKAGGIFVTVHMGSWEVAGAYEGLRGVPLTGIALSHADPRVDQIFQSIRREAGTESVPVDGGLGCLRQALAQGRFTAILADWDVSGRGLKLPFFGQVTRVPAGHAVLALWTGAWILPVCIYRRPDGGLVIDFRPPIVPDRSRDNKESLTLRCLKILEEFISSRPEQWACFVDLWDQPAESSL
jgi:lauroyl/myristoyl acyltransferase